MTWFVIILYFLAMTALLILSLGQLHLTFLYRKKSIAHDDHTTPQQWPLVTVQLPIYNEMYVVKRLLKSISQLNYPKENLDIQILDDSTDETTALLAEEIKSLQAQGFMVSHIRRSDRAGFKAGALQYGLNVSNADYLAVFDADFLPNPNFLTATLPHLFTKNIGMVQARWGHVNQQFSLITQLQAFGLDGHFTVEQHARNQAGSFINFNGTAGIWKKECIVDAGGWSADTLTEDLDLSYRAQLKGWKFRYLEDIVVPAELPVVMSAVKSQQYRWNKGAAENTRKNLWQVLKAPLGRQRKLHAIFHLSNNTVFPLVLIASILSVPMLVQKQNHPEIGAVFHAASIFVLGFLAIAFFYLTSAQKIASGNYWRYWLYHFPLFLAYSMGLSLHNAIAVSEGYLGIKTPFIRTPKFNIHENDSLVKPNKYVQRHAFTASLAFEAILCIYFATGVALGVFWMDFGLVPFHAIMSLGYGMVVYFSIMPKYNHAPISV